LYPVYLTLGNIGRKERRKSSNYVILGYLPIIEGNGTQIAEWRKIGLKSKILHYCLKSILSSYHERKCYF